MKNSIIYSKQKNIGDIGETETILQFQRWNWAASYIKSDFGEDVDCNIFIDTLRTNLYFRCQVKSTCDPKKKRYVRKLKSGDYSISIKTRHLKAWLFSYYPVLLIIYDDKEDCLYWADPLEQTKDNLNSLTKKTMTIHVKHERVLSSSQNDIENLVKEYYKNLLRIDSNEISCMVFPIIMPGYKLMPLHLGYSLVDDNSKNIKSKLVHEDKNSLPAWTALINTLTPSEGITSIKFNYSNSDLKSLINTIKDYAKNYDYKLKANEWISFVCSPIELSSKNSIHSENNFWKK
jgi:hypothetical protein